MVRLVTQTFHAFGREGPTQGTESNVYALGGRRWVPVAPIVARAAVVEQRQKSQPWAGVTSDQRPCPLRRSRMFDRAMTTPNVTTANVTTTGTTNYVERHKELLAGFGKLTRIAPDVMAGFGAMHKGATHEGALSNSAKELIALAIGICVQCDGCIAFHVHDALKAGATRPEIEEAIGVAVLMGGGPAAVYATDALTALDQFEQQ